MTLGKMLKPYNLLRCAVYFRSDKEAAGGGVKTAVIVLNACLSLYIRVSTV